MNPSSLIGHIIELLKLIDSSTQPADRTTSSFFRERKYLGAQDRRAISETIFGIIRHRRLVEALLEQYLIEHPEHGELDDRTSRYLPIYVAYIAAVDSAGAQVPPSLWGTYYPSIDFRSYADWLQNNLSLSFLGTDTHIQLGVKYSFQDWMIEEWSEEYGDSTEKFLQSLNTPARTTLRVNLLKATREECQDRLREEGIESIPTTLSPSGLKTVKRFNAQSSQAFKEGWFEVQDEGSQLVSIIAGPRPGQIVIDGCAGAGGKSLHMAERMHDEGEIVAVDVDGRRLLELQHRARRAGVTCVSTILREQLQPENFIGKADLVFLDAPCSGTGTIRRNPWFKWSVTESLVSHFSELQLNILSFNAQFVKTGGKLVYVTCSLFKKENEEIVGKFLSTNSDFRYGTTIPSELSGQIQLHDGCVKLTPDRYDTDGFVLHSLQKV